MVSGLYRFAESSRRITPNRGEEYYFHGIQKDNASIPLLTFGRFHYLFTLHTSYQSTGKTVKP